MQEINCADEFLIVLGHCEPLYSGIYCKEEDWDNYPHFEN